MAFTLASPPSANDGRMPARLTCDGDDVGRAPSGSDPWVRPQEVLWLAALGRPGLVGPDGRF